jgi:hypothetical protein
MSARSVAPVSNVALLRFRGFVRGKDLIEATRALHEDGRWHHAMDLIWDCSGVSSLDVQPHEMIEVVRLRTENTEGRDASVVTRTLDEAIAKLYRMVAERKGKKAFVCHSMEEALDVLSLNARVGDALERDLSPTE